MKTIDTSFLVAIVGGSGSGKSWLSNQLAGLLEEEVTTLSLDSFYRDRSRIPARARAEINYDHPEAVDWALFEQALHGCKVGGAVQLPNYDFATHTRLPNNLLWTPGRIVLVDGLWLLYPSNIRQLFDFSIYLDCSESLRLFRRLARDVGERGRSPDSVRKQFRDSVAPMHAKYVAPQLARADVVLDERMSPETAVEVANRIRELVRTKFLKPAWTCVSFRPELHVPGKEDAIEKAEPLKTPQFEATLASSRSRPARSPSRAAGVGDHWRIGKLGKKERAISHV